MAESQGLSLFSQQQQHFAGLQGGSMGGGDGEKGFNNTPVGGLTWAATGGMVKIPGNVKNFGIGDTNGIISGLFPSQPVNVFSSAKGEKFGDKIIKGMGNPGNAGANNTAGIGGGFSASSGTNDFGSGGFAITSTNEIAAPLPSSSFAERVGGSRGGAVEIG